MRAGVIFDHQPWRQRLVALGIALALGGLAGCGASEQEKAQAVVRAFLTGLAERDGAKVCAQLTREAARSLVERVDRTGRTKCPVALQRVVRRTTPQQRQRLRSARFTSTTVAEERATVRVQFQGTSGRRGAMQTFQLRKEDGDWKISARGGTSAPSRARRR